MDPQVTRKEVDQLDWNYAPTIESGDHLSRELRQSDHDRSHRYRTSRRPSACWRARREHPTGSPRLHKKHGDRGLTL
jgi:hypothetical protein